MPVQSSFVGGFVCSHFHVMALIHLLSFKEMFITQKKNRKFVGGNIRKRKPECIYNVFLFAACDDDYSDVCISVSRETVVAEEERYYQNTKTQKVYLNKMFEGCCTV